MTMLIECADTHFAWMLGDEVAPMALTLPPDGVDGRSVIEMLRNIAAKMRARCGGGHWLMVADREVVGLCGFKHAPKNGVAEIGFGVAASRRQRGHATRAIGALLKEVSREATVHELIAETATGNLASQRVLERNGFVKVGVRNDPEDGELVLWSRALR